ncbi:hypothetical protein BAL199_04324 [alpha proteobacterium BAL199]|jgi:hypothetical protein|nr:hypothetical protein BAL199_04324 [alpha proteobacterium BAL199]
MIKTLIFLTLFGCDDSTTQCDVLAQPTQVFETQAECQASAEELLDRSLDRPYPMLVTQCGTQKETIDYIAQVAPAEQLAIASLNLDSASSR